MSKLIPLFFVALAIAIAAALFMRPGTLVSVSDEALATSIARGADAEAGGCHHRGERWTCTDGDSRIYRASVGDYGCWEAVRVDAGGRIVSLEPVSGCVDLADVLSIGGCAAPPGTPEDSLPSHRLAAKPGAGGPMIRPMRCEPMAPASRPPG